LGFILVARNTYQDLDSISDLALGIWNVVGDGMSLYERLVKERKRLGKFVLRTPRTSKDFLNRKRWDRIVAILMHRYEYGIEDAMDQYRRQDQVEEIATIKKP
jgi:hypothetical protein